MGQGELPGVKVPGVRDLCTSPYPSSSHTVMEISLDVISSTLTATEKRAASGTRHLKIMCAGLLQSTGLEFYVDEERREGGRR